MVQGTFRAALGLLVAVCAAARADVPDPTLRAVHDRDVRVELDGAAAVEGRVLAFDPVSVTLAAARTHEVVTVPRERLVRVIVEPERLRRVGLAFGVPGTLAVDVERDRLHAFASVNALFPVLTASGDGRWIAGAIGAGVALPLTRTSRWKLDVFGELAPLHVTSWYTYVGAGIAAGFHYTGPTGLTVGFTFPVLGFATRLGSSPYGYDPSFRYNDSLGYFYLGSFVGLPLVTMGYRFAVR